MKCKNCGGYITDIYVKWTRLKKEFCTDSCGGEYRLNHPNEKRQKKIQKKKITISRRFI